MPLKLIPPRQGWSPFFRVRGTYLGVYVDRSTKTGQRGQAAKMLAKWQREIERGEFTAPGEPTFASAALGYMKAGGERTYLHPIIAHFGNRPLSRIGQADIDAAASAIYPGRSPATRNRQLYTPVSAVLRHAGVVLPLRRPRGSSGNKTTGWLWPEEATRLFEEARKLDLEFAALLILLCYTGMRLGHIYSLLTASAARANVTLPERQAFHLFRHTYATWMRRFGGLDTKGLVATGAWKDRKSADRYEHVVVTEEAQRAALLPGAKPVQKAVLERNHQFDQRPSTPLVRGRS